VRIISITAENFKRLKVFQYEPKGNVIKITGANASGKSSALDAIALALIGARGGPSVPVRRGAERGMVKLDLGEYFVTRQWYENGNPKGEMWIEAKDGRKYGTPQAVLDAAMGKISFDPLAFSNMEGKQQADELRKLLDLDEPLTQLKVAYDENYSTRTEQKRELDSLKAQRAAISYPEGLPAKKRNIDAMVEDLAKVSDFNMAIEREQMKRENTLRNKDEIAERSEQRRVRLEELQKEVERLRESAHQDMDLIQVIEDEVKAWKPLAKPKDANAISEEITAARGINAAIERREQGERLEREINAKGEAVAKLNRAIDDNRQAAADLIAKAQYPIPGLGFSEGEVMFNGLPFSQASDAERIKVSIAIAMVGNPKLRVMRIKDGSLLDDNSMAAIEQMAEEHDYQVWVERVDTTGAVGVYLVDGEIAAIDGEPLVLQPTPTLKAARKPREKVEK
jgi:hypothetical protein